MDWKIGKQRIWKLAGAFFAAMVVFTILSRAAYQHGIAVVTTQAPAGGTISHQVILNGKTVQNQEQAVTTEAGLRIAGVSINEGQQVKKGEVLFTLDLEYLEEEILNQKQEMQKQQLSIQDAWSQEAASREQRENQQAQAEENYNSAVSKAQSDFDRAGEELSQAEQALEDYYNGTGADQDQEEKLTAACEQAQADYEAAQNAVEQLQQEMTERIQQALDQAAAQLPDPTEEDQSSGLTPEEIQTITQQIQAEYTPKLSQAQLQVSQAKQIWDTAKAELDAFLQNGGTDEGEITEQELLEAVERAQAAYDEALAALEDAERVYGQAIDTANLPAAVSHSAQIGQISYDQMARKLEKLEALLEAEGKICAPVDGIVTESRVQTGEKTTDTTAVLLADLSQGCKFSGTITQEQSKYIGVGDKVTLRASSSGKVYKDLPVTTLSMEEETGQLTVQLPAGTLPLGASAEMNFTRKSQPYSCCVPLSALHLDERNMPYVLVVEPVETVLGTQMQARKVSVTVLEQNETTAALAEGAVHREQKIIVGADRAVDDGSRVRVG